MAKLLVRPAAAPRRTRVARSRPSTRNLGYLGLGWALAYIPVHLYWAFGGLSTPIGITGHQPGFRAANWGACAVIAGAALTCLTLTQRWGSALPAGGAGANRRATWPARFGIGLSLTGIAVVVWVVFTFHPWVFAGWGPAVLAAGLAILILGNRTSGNREGNDR